MAKFEDDLRAWEAFVEAAQKAQRTLRLDDGLAARRAWMKFLAQCPEYALPVEAAE